jgi:hypothetical protein
VGHGSGVRPPYRSVLVLSTWARSTSGYVEGKIRLETGGRQLSIREWCDAAFTLLVDSLRGPQDSLYKAIERATDMFLAPDELRAKQNREAFQKLKIPMRPPTRATDRVVPFQ